MKLIFTVLSCLALAADVVHSLHNGVAATIGQVPSQVAITLPNGRFCSGTIIHATHVLTAASCILDDRHHLMAANQTFVRAGSLVANNIGVAASPVLALFPHPEYSPFTGEHDIAVIRTQQNFTPNVNNPNPTFGAADRYTRIIPDTTVCTIAGWNAPTAAVPNPVLQTTTVAVLARDPCIANTPPASAEPLLESMMCARSEAVAANRPSICESNRGAGLFCRNQLVGVASRGFACGVLANVQLPGVYTQVRLYNNWILNQFNRTRIPVAGPTPSPGSSSTITSSILLIAVAMIFAW